MMLDFSPLVRSFAAQPFLLLWSSGGRVRRRATDFFVRLTDGSGVVGAPMSGSRRAALLLARAMTPEPMRPGSGEPLTPVVTYPETVDLAHVLAMPRWRHPTGPATKREVRQFRQDINHHLGIHYLPKRSPYDPLLTGSRNVMAHDRQASQAPTGRNRSLRTNCTIRSSHGTRSAEGTKYGHA
jgi:hypothetical protein